MQIPAAWIFFQGLNQGLCHGVADDGENVDAVAHHDVPDVFWVKGLLVIDHNAKAAKQIDQGGPHGRAVHHGRDGKDAQLGAVGHHHAQLFGRLNRALAEGNAAATQRRHEYGFMRPDHAFGHARGAACAQNVVVVFAAIGVAQFFLARGQQSFVGTACASYLDGQLHIGRFG